LPSPDNTAILSESYDL